MQGFTGWREALPTIARLAVAAVGIGVLATGAVAVFVTDNGTGAATLVVTGAALIAAALFANRLEAVEGGGFKLQMRAVAAKLREAERAEEGGDPVAADRLRRDAQELLAATRPLAARYEQVRESMPYGSERTRTMGTLVSQARAMAGTGSFTAEQVERLFAAGEDGQRIMAIGLMRGAAELASVSVLGQVVRRPRSSFEQFQALRVVQDLAETGRLSAGDRAVVTDAIAVARANGSLVSGLDRSRLGVVERIEAALPADG